MFDFNIQRLLIIIPIVLISIAIHEFAHCWTTDRLGDDTPRLSGRVTLNPLAHLDPLGTIMIVVTAMAGFGIGWGKPSPFNPANFRHPARDRMLTAIAGPLSNFAQLLAWASIGLLVTHIPLLATLADSILLQFCFWGILLNASLGLFNLLPIYPLDGHHVLSYFAPPAFRPLIDNPMWQFVLLAIVLIPELNKLILSKYLMMGITGVFTVTSQIVGWPPPGLL